MLKLINTGIIGSFFVFGGLLKGIIYTCVYVLGTLFAAVLLDRILLGTDLHRYVLLLMVPMLTTTATINGTVVGCDKKRKVCLS